MASSSENVIAVDLDGTLIQTDMLYESATYFLGQNLLRAFSLFLWLVKGRAFAKKKLADSYKFSVENLPYNSKLLQWLRERKKAGENTSVYLVTATDQKIADNIASHFPVFDGAYGSRSDLNLKGKVKADFLVEKFGEQRFEYVGDSRADFPVWEKAKQAHLVARKSSMAAKFRGLYPSGTVFESKSSIAALIRAVRPHQWLKNLLVFVPFVCSHFYGGYESAAKAVIAFFLFSLTASSVYLLNDLLDVEADRAHHRKKNRPFASGRLSLLTGWIVWPVLLVMALGASLYLLGTKFALVLIAYYTLTTVYSFYLKRKVILDVIALASLYSIRILAGSIATEIEVSFWILAFSMFTFLSLAFIKRHNELRAKRGRGENAVLSGRGYLPQDLEIVQAMGVSSGLISVLVLVFFIHDAKTANVYSMPDLLWLSCLLYLYWIARSWIVASRGAMHDDPVVFAIKDRAGWVIGFCFMIVVLGAKYL